ncbi:hypothetical protein Tco_0217266 [Tanacetum coccineum]
MSSDSASSEKPDSLEAAPALPDYVSGPEEPKQAPPLPAYVPGPAYPEYLAPTDDEIITEDQPYADYALPVALSPRYVADSDPKEDPEKDSEDGPVDYPADGGDDDDDDDSSNDDKEEEEEALEEEEHLAPADSVIAPTVDPVPSSEETELSETDESAATPPPPPVPTSSPLPSPPLPPLPASLFIPSPVDHRKDILEAELPSRKRLCRIFEWFKDFRLGFLILQLK